jgi:hypothetical protein
MNTKTRQEIIDIVSVVFCVAAICCFSYFGVEQLKDAGKSYLDSMCNHRHVRMCINTD